MTVKRDILNYLQFLQESGFLYVEGASAEELFRNSGIPGTGNTTAPKIAVPRLRPEKLPKPDAQPSDLFGAPAAAPLRGIFLTFRQ